MQIEVPSCKNSSFPSFPHSLVHSKLDSTRHEISVLTGEFLMSAGSVCPCTRFYDCRAVIHPPVSLLTASVSYIVDLFTVSHIQKDLKLELCIKVCKL